MTKEDVSEVFETDDNEEVVDFIFVIKNDFIGSDFIGTKKRKEMYKNLLLYMDIGREHFEVF
jgi:ribosome maturation protein Sdo1